MLMETRPVKLRRNQRGFASIIIALVLILVLSLITVGFAELMRREQRSALDKQLNSQAYYAAESGINQAVTAINAGYFNTNLAGKTSCGPISGDPYFSTNTVGASTGSSYPCLLINPTPPNLQYGSIGTTENKVVEFQAVDPNNLSQPAAVNTIEISWQDANGGTSFAPASNNCTSLYPAAGGATNWTYTGILRAELIPLNNVGGGNGLDRTDLINNALTAYLCPDKTSSNTSANYDNVSTDSSHNTGSSSGIILNGSCSASGKPRFCNATITNLNGANSLKEATFFLVLRSVYSPTAVTVTVCSQNCTSNDILNISGAQVLVDSTGKAQDVLRRIQVRVPVHNGYSIPSGSQAIQSLCKQLQLTPSGGNTDSSCPIP